MRLPLLLASLFLFVAPLPAAEPVQLTVDEPSEAALRDVLDAVAELRKTGDATPVVVTLAEGVYRLTAPIELTPAHVGSGLSLSAAKDTDVVFTTAVRLRPRAWHFQEPVTRYRLPENRDDAHVSRVMLIDGELRTPARHPNEGWLRIERSLPDRRSGFITQPDGLPANLSEAIGKCDVVLLHDWSSTRLRLGDYDPDTRTLRTSGPIGCAADHYRIDHFEKQPRYRLEGHELFADKAGEWCVREDIPDLVLRTVEQLATPTVEFPTGSELLIAAGTTDEPLKNLVLSGITFTGTTCPVPASGYATGQASVHEARALDGSRSSSRREMLGAAVRIDHGVGCRVQRCTFQHLGSSGLWLGEAVRNCRVTGCRFDTIGGNGLNLGITRNTKPLPTQNVVERNTITNCGVVMPGSVGIWASFHDSLTIADNHLHDLPYSGISLGWKWDPSPTGAQNNVVTRNRIEFVMQTLSDGGGVYTLGNQPGSRLTENVVSDIPTNLGRAESNGFFLDQGSTGFLIEGNTFRRIRKSPLRFHQADRNRAVGNRWELATASTPPARFNNTPEANITLEENTVLGPQHSYYLIGNSLTWDTRPPLLDGNVHYHVDCGKNLSYIRANPKAPCVGSSRLWPTALRTTEYDFLSVQPHYGTTLDEDVAAISAWIALQPQAVIVIHTGWAHSATLAEEWADDDAAGPLTHSDAYLAALLERLRKAHPETEFRATPCTALLNRIREDIKSGSAPFDEIENLYRDAIHMNHGPGRYLMHNAMRQTLGQPHSAEGFPKLAPEVKAYLDGLLNAAE